MAIQPRQSFDFYAWIGEPTPHSRLRVRRPSGGIQPDHIRYRWGPYGGGYELLVSYGIPVALLRPNREVPLVDMKAASVSQTTRRYVTRFLLYPDWETIYRELYNCPSDLPSLIDANLSYFPDGSLPV